MSRNGIFRVHFQYPSTERARLVGRSPDQWYVETFQHRKSAEDYLEALRKEGFLTKWEEMSQ